MVTLLQTLPAAWLAHQEHKAQDVSMSWGALLQDTLFADLETYEYMAREQLAITAWYVATEFEDAYDVGLEAAQALAAKFPGDEEKASNIAWYEMLRESGSASSGSSVHTSDPGESSAL